MTVLKQNTYKFLIDELTELFVDKKSGNINEIGLVSSIDKPVCKSNQFCYAIEYPNLKLSYLSSSFNRILGYQNDFSFQEIISIIHPEDIIEVSCSNKNACEFILNNYKSLSTGSLLHSNKYRIRNTSGKYYNVINHTYLWKKGIVSSEFKLLSYITIISNFINNSNLNNLFESSNNHQDGEIMSFTQRELEILSLLALGKNSVEIGTILKISKHTVDTHRRKMLAKSKLCNTPELIAYSLSRGWIEKS